ncbi:serine O-acetyltransferase [Robiginitalea myxolifaciens]|uniref:Serine O-acetyltransferase n=1 Tax=Robiginitalea myxolifaciens TaxID=400055 RepID=A0A1I6GXJ8_9FLAO|nr:serine O-acetyltransferase EpsC [Robiginitalea myxolifaciens]SFR46791.1 serine O-acetyltransferase [Robiginitalea myxolifaciens]
MDRSKITRAILEHKNNPGLKFRLKHRTEAFTDRLFLTLFDQETPVAENMNVLEREFEELVELACWDPDLQCKKLWDQYLDLLPDILRRLNMDAQAIVNCDPASLSIEEVYMAYPGFYAIAIYRLAHELFSFGFPLVPRLMTEYAHRQTGVDIHPGAKIGDSFFIDHATGVVIGETAEIHNNVKVYQGVTLGALYVAKSLQRTKRHPTIEDNVTIYANATILGGSTVIGANSVIGGNAWLTESVPPYSKVFHSPEIVIKTRANVE